MAVRRVVFSDLSNEQVADADHVSIIVKDHPTIEGPVRLDASASEIANLADNTADFVIIEVHSADTTDTRVIELRKFEKLFKGDPQEILDNAERVTAEPSRGRGRPKGTGAPAPRSTGSKTKRDPAQLQAIRDWARANGWPDLSNRGRIPAEAEAAYNQK